MTFKSYNAWIVQTEAGFESGRLEFLGVYGGELDEIAFHLAKKACTTLRFERPVIRKAPFTTTSAEVHVNVENQHVECVARILRGRPVMVRDSSIHGAVRLQLKDVEAFERAQALAKLTEREREVLGLSTTRAR